MAYVEDPELDQLVAAQKAASADVRDHIFRSGCETCDKGRHLEAEVARKSVYDTCPAYRRLIAEAAAARNDVNRHRAHHPLPMTDRLRARAIWAWKYTLPQAAGRHPLLVFAAAQWLVRNGLSSAGRIPWAAAFQLWIYPPMKEAGMFDGSDWGPDIWRRFADRLREWAPTPMRGPWKAPRLVGDPKEELRNNRFRPEYYKRITAAHQDMVDGR